MPAPVLVRHAMPEVVPGVLTLYLGESVEFWAALSFPDAWSALAGELRRVH